MAFAVERLAELGGGIVAVDGLRVMAELPLPVAGLLADAPLAEVVERSRACNDAAHELGWTGATPFLTLSFLQLSVIPHLKITDRGLVDVDALRDRPARRMTSLYVGGWIVTCDDAGTEHESGWLLVEDGVIASVGGGAEPEADERVDLERRGRHTRPRQHASPPLPDPHARPGAGSRSLRLAS